MKTAWRAAASFIAAIIAVTVLVVGLDIAGFRSSQQLSGIVGAAAFFIVWFAMKRRVTD